MLAGESILTASSCTVATEGAELTSGSRGHRRRASPVAQIKRETRRLPHWHAAVAAALVGKHELNAKLPEIIQPLALCWLHVK